METNLHGNGLGRDTMVCGDPETWFPMRRVSSGKKGREWWWRWMVRGKDSMWVLGYYLFFVYVWYAVNAYIASFGARGTFFAERIYQKGKLPHHGSFDNYGKYLLRSYDLFINVFVNCGERDFKKKTFPNMLTDVKRSGRNMIKVTGKKYSRLEQRVYVIWIAIFSWVGENLGRVKKTERYWM